MLKGRLGLETARVLHADRHGLLWLAHGNLVVDSGTLRFITAGEGEMPAGDYAVPFQRVSCFVLQPGTTVSHDALRLCARHSTGLVAAGMDGVRMYASMPFGPDDARRGRRQAEHWADPNLKVNVARRMFAWRFGELPPTTDLAALRGIEGARLRAAYRTLGEQYGIDWRRRKYDRDEPESADLANQAVNHAATAMYALAQVAVAVTGTIPQLGFIHEDSGIAFALDVADLYRTSVVMPVAFHAVKTLRPGVTLERAVRQGCGTAFQTRKVLLEMIDRIKELFDDDPGGDPQRPGADPRVPGVGDAGGGSGGVRGPEDDRGGAPAGLGGDEGLV